MPATANIQWDGVDITTGWSMTLSPGIYPSQCTINSPPHSFALADYGNLSINYYDDGDGGASSVSFTFTDCILEKPTLQSSGAKIWSIPILDRRWKWRHGHISGEYNRQKPNGDVIRRQTPQQLATKLLQAMGESVYGYDISRLPNDSRPYRKWDYSNPAAELQSLCDELACDIVLNPLINKVEIWPIGEGPELPEGVTIGGSLPLQAIQKPESILVVTAPVVFETQFQWVLPLGIDTDGSVKYIYDLSYRPKFPDPDWNEISSPDAFTGTYIDPNGREQSLASLVDSFLWKAFELNILTDTGFIIPENFEDAPNTLSFDDCVVFNERITSVVQPGGQRRPLPATVDTNAMSQEAIAAGSSPWPRQLTDGFRIDNNRGHIWFSEKQILGYSDNGSVIEADGFVTTSLSILDEGVPYRWKKRYAVGGRGGTRVVIANNIQRKVIYHWNGGVVIGKDDNLAEVLQEVEKVRDQTLKEYTPIVAKTATYPGIKAIVPNGKIAQVTWAKQPAGAITTTASMSREHNAIVSTRQKRTERAKRERREHEALIKSDEATRAIETLEATRFIA